MKNAILLFSIIVFITSCNKTQTNYLYKSDTYTVGLDFVKQGKFEAKAISDTEIKSNYQVLSKIDIDTSATWKLSRDISRFPQFSSDSKLLNALYNMALEESDNLVTDDDYFDTGAKWGGVWTRDLSYASMLSLSTTHPDIVKNGLLKKVANDRIIQDTGTGGAWPVSTDRMIWVPAAFHLYKVTGDKEWLDFIYIVIKNSIEDDLKIAYSNDGLVKGESSFIDWRENSYPRWMQPVDIYDSENLGTVAAHYESLIVLSEISKILNKDASKYLKIATDLKTSINNKFWMENKGYYGNFLYGRKYLSLSPKAEALGTANIIRFGIADGETAAKTIENFPVVDWGTPVFYPQIPNIHPYHNNGIWPFVQGYWNLAAKKVKNDKAVEFGMASLIRGGALFLTNYENWVAETGDWEQTDVEAMNSHNMLWSVAAQLSNYYDILFGIEYNTNSITFLPLVPKGYGTGKLVLNNFKYRNSILNITVTGYGDGISSFKVNGKDQDNSIVASSEGVVNIEIIMNNSINENSKINLVPNQTSPETPVAKMNGNKLEWNSIDGSRLYQVIKNGKVIREPRLNYIKLLDTDSLASYQIKAIDSNGNESFLSEPIDFGKYYSKNITVSKFNNTSDNKNEHIVLSKIENNNISVNFKAPKSGKYFIKFEYANGSGPINTENKCAIRSLYVKNKYILPVVMPQRGEENWNEFGWSNTIEVYFEKGDNLISVKFDPFNNNMNLDINKALLKSVLIELK